MRLKSRSSARSLSQARPGGIHLFLWSDNQRSAPGGKTERALGGAQLTGMLAYSMGKNRRFND